MRLRERLKLSRLLCWPRMLWSNLAKGRTRKALSKSLNRLKHLLIKISRLKRLNLILTNFLRYFWKMLLDQIKRRVFLTRQSWLKSALKWDKTSWTALLRKSNRLSSSKRKDSPKNKLISWNLMFKRKRKKLRNYPSPRKTMRQRSFQKTRKKRRRRKRKRRLRRAR